MDKRTLEKKILVGELAARDDFIALLKDQVRSLGAEPLAYTGPRGLASYDTDNHVRPVTYQLDQLDVFLAHEKRRARLATVDQA